jgi:uncharacterized protein YlxP (DUF503 family)
MFIGTLRADLRLAPVGSLKQKRSVVRPIVAELRRRFEVSAGETGLHELLHRTEIGVGLVAGEAGHVQEVLQACERLLADRVEVDVLSVRRRVWNDEDE